YSYSGPAPPRSLAKEPAKAFVHQGSRPRGETSSSLPLVETRHTDHRHSATRSPARARRTAAANASVAAGLGAPSVKVARRSSSTFGSLRFAASQLSAPDSRARRASTCAGHSSRGGGAANAVVGSLKRTRKVVFVII